MDGNQHGHAHMDTGREHSYTNGDTNSDTDQNTNANAYAHCDRNANANIYAYANRHTADCYTYTLFCAYYAKDKVWRSLRPRQSIGR